VKAGMSLGKLDMVAVGGLVLGDIVCDGFTGIE
jgi:hypothetical protein